MNENSTIVFPSTHVVFEGLKEPKRDIDERKNKHISCLFLK